ncbi:unnamed protein product [Rhizophagus irregularis]|nr:unnamed protein product [Rhizophagus irregularis]
MSGSQPRVHATRSSTRQQQDKEDWQPASSRITKRKDKEKQVEHKQQKKQPRLFFRQHKSTEKTTDDMDISQDTFAPSSESSGAAKSNTDNQVIPENPDAPIDGEKNDEMIVDNGKIDNQTDDQFFNKDNQKNGDTNDIISDNHSEIFNKAKPILVKIKKDSIPGNNIIQKKFNLRKQLAGINVTLAGGVILNKKEPEFIILPIMKNDYDKIINLEIDIIDDEQSHENGEDAESSTNIYYENDEDIGIAAERNIIFCNRTLHWGTPGEKSCHRCGSFDHLISKCDIEPSAKPHQSNNSNNYSKYNNGNINRYWNKNISRDRNNNVNEKSLDQGIFTQIKQLNENLNKLANDFKKIQQENYRIKSEFYKYKENKSTTSLGKNIKVNQDRSTIALQNENNKRSRVDNEQLEASGSSDIENSLNKQNNKINRFSDALSTMRDKIIDNNESHED